MRIKDLFQALLAFVILASSQIASAQAPTAEVLDRYVGQYRLAPNRVIVITREGSRLFAQNTGAPKVEIFAEGNGQFSYKSINARLTFTGDRDGKADEVTVSASGSDRVAKRISDAEAKNIEAAALALSNVEVPVNPAILKSYVGYFEVREPYLLFSITQEGDKLFAEIVGQPKAQIFGKNDREFFYKVVPAQITFAAPDAKGSSARFVLHQGGKDYDAVRIDAALAQKKSQEVIAGLAAASAPKKVVSVPVERLKSYVGKYKLEANDMIVAISLDNGRLYSQSTVAGQEMPRQEIFPEAHNKFFYKNAPLQLVFVAEADAPATKMIVQGAGADAVALRIP